MKDELDENPENEPGEAPGVAGGLGLFLAQEFAHGDIPPILAVPREVALNQTAADLTLSDEPCAPEKSPWSEKEDP